MQRVYVTNLLCLYAAAAITILSGNRLRADTIDYQKQIQPILTKYCAGCHNASDAESGFMADSYEGLMKGSENGQVVDAADHSASRLIKMLRGEIEPKMPPDDQPQLHANDIDAITQWISAGASAPELNPSVLPLPTHSTNRVGAASANSNEPARKLPITSIAWIEDSIIAVGGTNRLAIIDVENNDTLFVTDQVIGKIASIRRVGDGSKLLIASGQPGLGGQISIFSLYSRKIIKQWQGHRDTLYAVAMSPDGQYVATGGYDKSIKLWNSTTAEMIRTFDGHNGAIYDLDFDPSSTLLVSSSADETSKIWQVASGLRLDTLSQGEAEQYCVRFDPSGNRIIAAGADRRIRNWQLISKDKESISPMLNSVFAHEKSVLFFRIAPDGKSLVTFGEDRSIKRWSYPSFQLMGELQVLPTIASDAAWNEEGNKLFVATLKGDIQIIDVDVSPTDKSKAQQNVASDQVEQRTPSMDDAQFVRALVVSPNEAVTAKTDFKEAEPNDLLSAANEVKIPAMIEGVIDHQKIAEVAASDIAKGSSSGVDEDWYAFDAKAGESWVITTIARQSGSPLDSKIEIRGDDGQPVLRTRLQALRETYFTFRAKDSSNSDDFRLHRWEDMELNEMLYSGGEVVKLWLYPRGPDSGFRVYPGVGSRYTYFDTTATTHALGEAAWIVRQLGTGEERLANGLPVFPIYYENDDDCLRRTDKDSRLLFVAPKDGKYFLRVRDARGSEGPEFKYHVSIQPQLPDFSIAAKVDSVQLIRGVGIELPIKIDRRDCFEGEVEVNVEGLPEGVKASTPTLIQYGQDAAIVNLYSSSDTQKQIPNEFAISVVARAKNEDGQWSERRAEKTVNAKVMDKKTIALAIVADASSTIAQPIEMLTMKPGQTISTFLKIERNGTDGDIAFGGDDSGRNLPHGIIVSNVGLSGLMVLNGQTVREVFITAAPWVKPQERPFHLRSTGDGTPATQSVILKIE